MKRHEFKNPVPVRERMAEKWKKRFMFEKGYSEECAEYMARRLCLSQTRHNLQNGESNPHTL